MRFIEIIENDKKSLINLDTVNVVESVGNNVIRIVFNSDVYKEYKISYEEFHKFVVTQPTTSSSELKLGQCIGENCTLTREKNSNFCHSCNIARNNKNKCRSCNNERAEYSIWCESCRDLGHKNWPRM
jgi:hypothetical protein